MEYPFGLTNKGNTCYMNAAIQAIFSSKLLIIHLMKDYEKLYKHSRFSPFAFSLFELLNNILQGNGPAIYDTTRICMNNPIADSTMYGQDDAQMWISSALGNKLESELSELLGIKPKKTITVPRNYEAWIPEPEVIYNLLGNNGINRTISSAFVRKYKCEYGHTWNGDTVQIERIITICSSGQSFFKELHKAMYAETVLEINSMKCKYHDIGCVSKIKFAPFYILHPQVLMIMVNPSQATGGEIKRMTDIPIQFRLMVDDAEITYRMCGVVIYESSQSHFGRSGHYYAYVKKNHKWYCCNDQSITGPIDIGDILLFKSPYMFVFDRVR